MTRSKYSSLDRKIHFINILTLLGIIVLILISAAAAVEGMKGFGNVLSLNEKTKNFWNAIENEGKAFRTYIEEEDPEAYENLEDMQYKTQVAIMELPYDYNTMSLDQYTQTTSILNTYKSYKELQQKLLQMDTREEAYQDDMAQFYTIQQYLEDYAGKLETLTVEQGSIQYKEQQGRFVIIPAICLIAGGIIMIIFIWFRNYAANKYITAMEEKHLVEKQLVETRYQMLKNQIKPHFLFNTLNLIASTAEIEDASTTEKMIVTLSHLFRYNLKSQTTFMPLEQELKVVSDYMYLQTMRFGVRIHYSCDVAPETLQVLVPSFVLQPLVENAVIHGLSKSSKGGIVHIRCWMKEDLTWISVADTGVGMDAAQFDLLSKKLIELRNSQAANLKNDNQFGEINNQFGKNNNQLGENNDHLSEKSNGTGIGLCNIAERIYGMNEENGMHIYSRPGCGTAIQIYLKNTGNNEKK